MVNYYEVLGVASGDDHSKVKSRYKALAKLHHPDKGGDASYFRKIAEAYKVISDPEKRAELDSYLAGNSGKITIDMKVPNFEEFLDIDIRVILTTRDIYNGEKIQVEYDRYEPCENCMGSGLSPDGLTDECLMCDCTGLINGSTCKYCRGLGKIMLTICPECGGNKNVLTHVDFNLTGVSAIRESKEVKLQCYGHRSRYYDDKVGDVNMIVIVEELLGYSIVDGVLNYSMRVPTGVTNIEHTLPDDSVINIEVHETFTSGYSITVKNKGLMVGGTERGDLIINLET